VGKLFGVSVANATTLPPAVLRFIKDKDPEAKVRFDGLVLFSNGELYIPVFPPTLAENPDPKGLLSQDPPNVAYPDSWTFDNNTILLRLVPTTTGKLTLPRRVSYPLALREGLFPQDFLIPETLSIPTELRALLGSIPYEPPQESDTGENVGEALLAAGSDTATQRPPDPLTLYVSDLNKARLVALDPNTGLPTWQVNLRCLPTALRANTVGNRVYVACSSTAEAVMIDTLAGSVMTRISTPSAPSQLATNPTQNLLVTSNPDTKTLTLIDAERQLKRGDLTLPSAVEALAIRPDVPIVMVAAKDGATLYEVDTTAMRLLRTFTPQQIPNLLPNVSHLWWDPQPEGLGRLWLLSRQEGKVQVLDVLRQTVLMTQEVGRKPVQLHPVGDSAVWVLSAGNDTLYRFDRTSLALDAALALPEGSFPTAVATDSLARYAYITSAAQEALMVVDVETGDVLKTYPTGLRALAATLFDQRLVADQQKAIEAWRDRSTPKVQQVAQAFNEQAERPQAQLAKKTPTWLPWPTRGAKEDRGVPKATPRNPLMNGAMQP
jgi:DNA-binding beta-propeller fold protein YncE